MHSCVKSVLCEHVLHLFPPGFCFFFLKIVFECAATIVAGGQICCMHPSMSNLNRRSTFGIKLKITAFKRPIFIHKQFINKYIMYKSRRTFDANPKKLHLAYSLWGKTGGNGLLL